MVGVALLLVGVIAVTEDGPETGGLSGTVTKVERLCKNMYV